MLISHKYRFVYLTPIRTGSASIASVLVDQFEAFVHKESFPDECEDYFIWASVRNPYTRFISAYNWFNRSQMKPIPIQETMTDPPLLQSLYGAVFEDTERLDSYVKIENLAEDFAALPFGRSVEFPVLHASPCIIEELDQSATAYVQHHYQKDFEHFDYDPLPPVFKLYL